MVYNSNKHKLEILISLYLICLPVFGMFFFGERYNLSLYIDLLLMMIGLFSISKINRKALLLFLVPSIYLIFSFQYSVIFGGDNILDFILAYKFVIYLLIGCVFLGKGYISPFFARRLFYVLLFLFIIKYTYSYYVGMDHRPVLYAENNFELMFLLLLSLLVYYHYRFSPGVFLLLLYVFVLSGSKSGILSFILAYFIVLCSDLKIKDFASLFVFTVIGLLAIGYVFTSRGALSIESIDRYKFLMVFMSEYKQYNALEYIFGAKRLTPLSDTSCYVLSYYERLFSFKGDGSCYPVILHSFHLRVLLEHGVMIYAFLIYSVYKLLRYSGYPVFMVVSFLAVMAVNGMSVSSFNSSFFVLSLFFYLSLTRCHFKNMPFLVLFGRYNESYLKQVV